MICRPLRSTGPEILKTSSEVRSSSRSSSSSTSSDMESATSRRTAPWKRRRRSSISTAVSRSSASSSLRVRSALRVSRKAWCSSSSMPAKSAPRCAEITSSSATKRTCGPLVPPVGTHRARVLGTFTLAKRSSPSTGSRIITARFSDRSEMNGNGWPGSTASGVSTGNTRSSKCARSTARSSASSWSHDSRKIPSLSRAGRTRCASSRCCCAHSSSVTRRISATCSTGDRPSKPASVIPAATRSLRPATRTWKNSSRLVEKMLKYLARSSSGTSARSARLNTLALNASQESSRLK